MVQAFPKLRVVCCCLRRASETEEPSAFPHLTFPASFFSVSVSFRLPCPENHSTRIPLEQDVFSASAPDPSTSPSFWLRRPCPFQHPAGSRRVAKLFQPSFQHLFAFCLYPSDERRHEQGSQVSVTEDSRWMEGRGVFPQT